MLGRPASTLIPGPAGDIEVVIEIPDESAGAPVGWVVLGHPHPQMGGTMDNKVVHTLARACVAAGWAAIRFNFRGVGHSQGQWDEGKGEVADMLAVWSTMQHDTRWTGRPWLLGGFSFGGHVALQAGQQLAASGHQALGLLLVSPAVARFASDAACAPALVVQGDEDEVVPMSAVLAWARPNTQPVVVVPGAGHFFHGHLGTLKQIVTRHVHALA